MRLTPTGGKQYKKNRNIFYTYMCIYIQRHCYRRKIEENEHTTTGMCNNNSVIVVLSINSTTAVLEADRSSTTVQ